MSDASTPWTLHTDGVLTCADGLSPFSSKRSADDKLSKKRFMVNSCNSYGHFTDPVSAAEQDLLGQALAELRTIAMHCSECNGTSRNMLDQSEECLTCTGIRSLLAQTKEPRK